MSRYGAEVLGLEPSKQHVDWHYYEHEHDEELALGMGDGTGSHVVMFDVQIPMQMHTCLSRRVPQSAIHAIQ